MRLGETLYMCLIIGRLKRSLNGNPFRWSVLTILKPVQIGLRLKRAMLPAVGMRWASDKAVWQIDPATAGMQGKVEGEVTGGG